MAGKEKGRMTDRGTLGESMDERYGRYRQIIRDFTLMSDTFMRNVCREKDCVEHILQVIMGQVGLRVVESVAQSDYKNMQGRSAILDCVARDTEERRYNMEVQQKSEGALPWRAAGYAYPEGRAGLPGTAGGEYHLYHPQRCAGERASHLSHRQNSG